MYSSVSFSSSPLRLRAVYPSFSCSLSVSPVLYGASISRPSSTTSRKSCQSIIDPPQCDLRGVKGRAYDDGAFRTIHLRYNFFHHTIFSLYSFLSYNVNGKEYDRYDVLVNEMWELLDLRSRNNLYVIQAHQFVGIIYLKGLFISYFVTKNKFGEIDLCHVSKWI